MNITKDIKYVGVNDRTIDLFEGQYLVPNGISYNSYIIIDEKIAVMDSVDKAFGREWLDNIKDILGPKEPNYLIVQHMEPDHSANILNFTREYPEAKIVASKKAFDMMKSFFGIDFSDKGIVVSDGDALKLGEHTLKFFTAPMVHWPEVIVTYDDKDKVLFSADGFGKFGALDFNDEWEDEARRYYIGIVGKYGAQVKNLIKKAASLDIKTICPLHGPALSENIRHYIELYEKWASYTAEEEGIVIAYTSIYGNTEKAVFELRQMLFDIGYDKVILHDLARCDMACAVADAFKYTKLVLATTTYNGEVFPFMREYINHLTERNFSSRKVAFIENGSWSPMAAKVMREMLAKSKNLEFLENSVTIMSALNDKSKEQLSILAKELSSL